MRLRKGSRVWMHEAFNPEAITEGTVVAPVTPEATVIDVEWDHAPAVTAAVPRVYLGRVYKRIPRCPFKRCPARCGQPKDET